MRISRRLTLMQSISKPVALSITTTQWTNRVQASGLLNGGTVGHDSSNHFYALALAFTAPRALKKLTLHLAGTITDYQANAQYRAGVAASLPANNATTGTVIYTATGASASSGKSYTMTAAGEISGSFSAGQSYTLWLWTSSTPTDSVSYINKSTITMEGI